MIIILRPWQQYMFDICITRIYIINKSSKSKVKKKKNGKKNITRWIMSIKYCGWKFLFS